MIDLGSMALRDIHPQLDILPEAQRRLWLELGEIAGGFILYGGTAIALQLGHRDSVDFDFFSFDAFTPDVLLRTKVLSNALVTRRDEDALTVRVDRGGPVFISFFSTPWLGQIEPVLRTTDTGIKVAALIDLAGLKADVVQKRAEAKDYRDLDALFDAGISLDLALSAARSIQGPSFNPQVTLKALSSFSEGDLASLPSDMRRRIQDAVRLVDLDRLPPIEHLERVYQGASS
jgi:hypothetical protein